MEKKKEAATFPWWNLTIAQVCTKLETDAQGGLTGKQIQERLDCYGPNELPEQKKISIITLFLSQFSSIIVWILIGALIVSGALGEWQDALSIGIIVFLNAIIGFIQEYHAEKSLEALRKLTKPTSRVIRNGSEQTIPSHLIVPGDLILLEAGDYVPADGRIIQVTSLATQEASL